MLLQTNSYIVPKDKRSEHARLLRKFRQTLARLGCDQFEVYEQVGANWAAGDATGRFVQIMRFRDRKHQQDVQAGERQDPVAQQLIQEFCALINFPYQQQQGLFAVGFYASSVPIAPPATAARGTSPKSPGGATPPPMPPSTPAQAPADERAIELPEKLRPESEGASLLDFGALAGGVPEQPAPMRLADEVQDAVVESSMPAADDSRNGDHAGGPSPDTPEAMLDLVDNDVTSEVGDDAVMTDADREAILGELTDDDDDDADRDRRRQQAEGR